MSYEIGLLLFPDLTQLDLTGPYEVFANMPDVNVHLIWKTLDPVVSETGLTILPTTRMDACPNLDVICVPGGPGQIEMMEDEGVLAFLRTQADGAQYVTSVCTGALVLGAAGLLEGYNATTYWASTDCLEAYGATFTEGRVVKDRNRITGGGVTAGIDTALAIVAELAGEDTAKAIQLGIEYNPAPPFDAGHPTVAPEHITDHMRAMMQNRLARRRAQADAYAARKWR